jgi:hypothetical protein
MTLEAIEREALNLPEKERTELVLSLMSTLSIDKSDVTDAEGLRRDEELESGKIEPMLHEEFVRRVKEERGR